MFTKYIKILERSLNSTRSIGLLTLIFCFGIVESCTLLKSKSKDKTKQKAISKDFDSKKNDAKDDNIQSDDNTEQNVHEEEKDENVYEPEEYDEENVEIEEDKGSNLLEEEASNIDELEKASEELSEEPYSESKDSEEETYADDTIKSDESDKKSEEGNTDETLISAEEEQIPAKEGENLHQEQEQELSQEQEQEKEQSVKADSEIEVEKDKKEPIKYNIEYSSDTMYFDIIKGKVQLTGNGNVNYGPNKLEAHKIGINWKKNILSAEAKKTGNEILIKDKFLLLFGGKEYYADKLKVNLESQLAYIKSLFTKIEETIVRAKTLKKSYDDTLYVDNLSITSCNLPTPHYCITGKKVIIEGEERIISESLSMDFNETPTLRLFFGLLFIPQKKNGIIPPTYGGSGEFKNKGFHIKKFGYYWNFNDRVDLAVTADLHTGGSIGFEAESFYKKRYTYNGDIMYRLEKIVDKNDYAKKAWKFKWNHNSENNLYSSIFTKIDLENEEYAKDEEKKGVSQNATQTSSIKYNARFRNIPYALGMKAEYVRNKSLDKTSLILPHIILYSPLWYIFNNSKFQDSWFSDFNLRHSIGFKNSITTKRTYLDFFDPKDWGALYDKKNYGLQNTLSGESNIAIGFFNLIPKVEYKERWYWEQLDYNDDRRKNLKKGFCRVWSFEPSIELDTTIYGTFLYNSNKQVEAIRHQINPSIKLTYSHGYPDYWRKVGDKHLNKFDEFVFDTPDYKKRLVLEGIISNRLDIKLREKDEKGMNIKTPILESFDIIYSYDFLDKDYPVGDIEFKVRTSFFKKHIYIEGSQKYDQYCYSQDNNNVYTKEKKLAISNNQGLGHLKEGRLSIVMNLDSQLFQGGNNQMEQLLELLKKKAATQDPEAAAEEYVRFNVPWSLELKYDYTYKSPTPNEITRSKVLFTDLKLNTSAKWMMGIVTAYDFSKGSIVRNITKLSIIRDLHCWQLSFSWLPISKTERFDFSIGIKTPMLKAIEYTRKDRRYTNV